MVKKPMLLLLAALLLAGGLAAWAALRGGRDESDWSTGSPAALAELRAGLDAERKYYRAEARERYARALELDPQFAAARLGMLRCTHPETPAARELLATLATVDRRRLSEREAFLVDYTLARRRGDDQRAATVARSYLAAHPDDPYALEVHAEELWLRNRFAEAERVLERMLEIDPNYVVTQNRLGYLAMSQGRFAAAEDRFRTYLFVAPDQANPHDSLGELFVLTGRWDEARRELEEALRIRPDFCSAYEHLTTAAILVGRPEEGVAVLERARQAGQCDDQMLARRRCRAELWQRLLAGDYATLAGTLPPSCSADYQTSPWISHLAALLAGDLVAAQRVERRLAESLRGYHPAKPDPTQRHLQGVRLVVEGRLEQASQRLASVDAELTYFGADAGLLKLYNRLHWANARELAGDAAGAARLVGEVEAVNAPFAALYRSGALPRPRPRERTAGR